MSRWWNGIVLLAVVAVVGCGVQVTQTAPAPKPKVAAVPLAEGDKPVLASRATPATAGVDTPAGPAARAPLAEAGGGLAITPENTKLEWVGTKDNGKHTGGFKQFRGSFALNDKDVAASKVSLDIDAESLYSDNAKLTQHLKSADFFEVATHPKAGFTSTAFKPAESKGATHTVTGDLTLHGVTKPITFPATIKVGDDQVSLDTEFKISRKEFGMTYGAGKIHDDVTLKVEMRLPRK
jgi:polyisoprenoid-binding protein YceI